MDLKEQYSDKKFVKLENENLPFADNEFDFVIASHVLEHVKDPTKFLNEISRVANQGYIEVPTKLEDNLVFENKKAHLWHLTFDDVNQVINISKKIQFLSKEKYKKILITFFKMNVNLIMCNILMQLKN